MKVSNFKVFTIALIILLMSSLVSITFFNFSTGQTVNDTDGDGLTDKEEITYHTSTTDKDSDDDGVLDGQEKDWNKDTDGDKNINALDRDSDGDGIFDGVEMGITEDELTDDTDRGANNFFPDADDNTTTSMVLKDTDGDHLLDGEEDKNKNGRYEKDLNETDPNFADRDNDGEEDSQDKDIDGDGMPNEFEELFDLDPWDPDDATADPDDDGVNNLDEYLGDDKKPGNSDWSNPNDPNDEPDKPPRVDFTKAEIEEEAEQDLQINRTILIVEEDSDEDWEKGLSFTWEWGDDNIDYQTIKDKTKVKNKHVYEKPGTYELKLSVKDQNGNIGDDTISVTIKTPVGETETIYEVKPDEDESFKHKKVVRRNGWIGYKLVDVKSGEKITIEYEVTDKSQGLRIFIIPAKNLQVYRENEPSNKPISDKYKDYWEGHVGEIAKKGKIEFTAEEDDDILVLFDNNHYLDYKKTVEFNEPVEFTVEITREESPLFTILIIIIVIIVIIAVVIAAFFYKKLREAKGMTKVTREAAIETQRSLDREMAQLELEIQDSLRRQTIARGPMKAMPMQQQRPQQMQAPAQSGQPRPGAPTTAAPGRVPQMPATVPGPAAGARAAPGTAPAPTQAAPGQRSVASTGPGPAAQQPGAAPAQATQQQALPPAQQNPQPGTVPIQKPRQPTQ